MTVCVANVLSSAKIKVTWRVRQTVMDWIPKSSGGSVNYEAMPAQRYLNTLELA